MLGSLACALAFAGANKNLPSQMVDLLKGKTIHRKSVGVRIPDDPFCQVGMHVCMQVVLG
jgi:hypothetical protein